MRPPAIGGADSSAGPPATPIDQWVNDRTLQDAVNTAVSRVVSCWFAANYNIHDDTHWPNDPDWDHIIPTIQPVLMTKFSQALATAVNHWPSHIVLEPREPTQLPVGPNSYPRPAKPPPPLRPQHVHLPDMDSAGTPAQPPAGPPAQRHAGADDRDLSRRGRHPRQ